MVSCASTPPSNFYILNSLGNQGEKQQNPSTDKKISIGINPIEIPDYLDRPQIVTQNSQNELHYAEFERWAGSLKENISMVLAENLSALLSTDHVFQYPWIRHAKVDYWLTVNIIKLDGSPGNNVSLKALWTISSGPEEKELTTRMSNFTERLDADNYRAMVAAMSRTVENLSREIAAELRSVSQEKK